MAENSKIEWTDHTWSPVWGCTQVSKSETGGGGCDNCYAMVLAHRFGTGWNGAPMREFADDHWDKPVRWNKRAAASGKRPKVFPSMCDPLDKDWPDALRERFWRLVDATPYLTWLILTKRIGNATRFGPGAVIGRWPANVWLGATVVNQAEADRDVPKLLAAPARVRFLSVEPMLGPIDLTDITLRRGTGDEEHFDALHFDGAEEDEPDLGTATLDWVICGAESGHGARPMHPDWARSLRDQCAAAGVPFLFKQWGEWGEMDVQIPRDRAPTAWINSAGHVAADQSKFQPGEAYRGIVRYGKPAAGRLLDGIEHNGFPEVHHG